jgi:MRG-binding protein
MHKHFRMLALSEYLRNHGYDPQVETHTKIPGIWQKLRTLYNMPIIDDRENSFEYEDEFHDKYHEFELPPDDYATETFLRGKLDSASDTGSISPKLGQSPSLPVQPARKRKRGETITQPRTRASTIEDTDETRTSPVRSSPAKATRSGRSANRRAAAESSSRPPSRETTIDEEMDDGEADVEEDAEEEDQETEEEESNSPKASKGTRSKTEASATRKSRRKK